MSKDSTNEAKQVATGVLVSWAEMTIAQKKEDLTARLTNEIAITSSSWVKTRDTLYITLLGYANDYMINKINSWIS